jgi:hypothetical protein
MNALLDLSDLNLPELLISRLCETSPFAATLEVFPERGGVGSGAVSNGITPGMATPIQLPACLRNVSVEGQAGASAAVVSVNAGCSPQQQLRGGVARDVSGDHGTSSAPACAPAGIQEGQIVSRGTTDVTIR